ncbi:MAG: AzlC family ABC transporter permease [Marmoricola sp.]
MRTSGAVQDRSEHADTRLRDLRRAALRDILAVMPGVLPFGVTLGIAAQTMGTGAPAALVGAVAVYGGSAQLATMTVLHAGAGLLAAVLSGVVVNARLLLYGAALEPRFRDQPLWFRLLAPQFIVDQTYLAAIGRPQVRGADFRQYWAWLGGFLLLGWVGAVALGLFVGPQLPAMPHLVLVGTALFVALLVPRLVDRDTVVAAGVSVVTALVVHRVAPEGAILVGTVTGVAAALALRERSRA